MVAGEQLHNLPVRLTSFVGRESELEEVGGLVASRRLVTLTGVGGGGKTRLATQAAERGSESWRDGVWLVDLGSITDPGVAPAQVASTLGVLVEPGGDQVEALVRQLRSRQLLMVLDTCEHLLDAVAHLAGVLLGACPELSLLATSREPLGVPGETVWQIPPLREAEAVRLFADRAGLVAPRFDAAAAERDVAAVCRRVDCVPLAVELAAAWVRALTPAQIAAGLQESIRLLSGASRAGVPRHQTLLASMRWSHSLLTEEERVFFRRLSVFSGTFTLAAAAAVCTGTGTDPGADREAEVLPLVGRLLDTSLVTVRERTGEIRYRLLDTIRQYAAEQLAAAGETDETRDRHLEHFLAVAVEAEPGLDSDQDRWREVLEGHHDNIAAACEWGLEAGAPADRVDRGRRLAAAMARYWFVRGRAAQGLGFLDRALALAPEARSPLQARLLAGSAMLGMVSGRKDLVAEASRRGLELAEETGEDRVRARCLTMLAYPLFFVDFERCQTQAAAGREAGEAAGDGFARDWAAVLEGYSLQTRNRHAEATAVSRPALESSRSRGDRFCAAFALGIEIYIELVSGDVRRAAEIGWEVIDIVAPLGDYFAVGTNTVNAALAVGAHGDVAEARALMEPVIRALDTAPEADVVGFMVPHGFLHLWAGDLDGAVHWFRRGVRPMAHGRGDWTAARCLPGLVSALRRLGSTDEAADLAAEGVALVTGFGAPFELANLVEEQGHLARPSSPDVARDRYHQALDLRVAHGLRSGFADSLDAMAGLAADVGQHRTSARLLGCGDRARPEMGYPRPAVDHETDAALRETLGRELGETAYNQALVEGADRSLDETVAALTRGRGPRGRPQSGWDSLTPTEREVVDLVTDGMTNPEIAARLFISRSTVKAHLSHVFAKLEVANRTELATLAGARAAQD